MRIATTPRPQEHTWIWLAKIASGVVVFAILAIHLVVNHMVASGGLLSYADVVAYYANPIVPVMEGSFLVFVVCHALLGVRGIALDLNPRPAIVRAMDIALAALGIVAVGYGLSLLATIASRA